MLIPYISRIIFCMCNTLYLSFGLNRYPKSELHILCPEQSRQIQPAALAACQ